jgi:hypothetical protein
MPTAGRSSDAPSPRLGSATTPFFKSSRYLLLLFAMGLTFSNLFGTLGSLVRWSKDQDVRILMLGLDSAGKARDSVSLG